MQLIQSILSSNFSFPENTLLFDIETTGLSADTSYIYLIGAIYLENESLVLTQWFCDNYSEEKELLLTFQKVLSSFSCLIHYNGTGFDIPYLNKKWNRHCIPYQIMAEETIDIYKLLLPFKKYTSLKDFKQKTVEQSAGFHRTDIFSGKDLTELYTAYTGKYQLATLTGNTKEADQLRQSILLHNHDDLLGLLTLYQKTKLLDFLSGKLSPSVLKIPEGILLSFDIPLLPFSLTLEKNNCQLIISDNTTDLFLPIYEGTLKYFFKDYKNYSYLKYEDTAVHNSIAEWIDKEAKEKCKPATAYQKKESIFLALPFQKPEQQEILKKTPLFYQEYKTLPTFIEYNDTFICTKEFIFACYESFFNSKFPFRYTNLLHFCPF